MSIIRRMNEGTFTFCLKTWLESLETSVVKRYVHGEEEGRRIDA